MSVFPVDLFPPYARLLLLLLHDGDLPEAVRAELQSAPVELLQVVVDKAFMQGVPTLFYSKLKQHGLLDRFSFVLQKRLENQYRSYAAYITRYYYDIGQVAAMLEAAGIGVLLLKGAHLAAGVYDSPVHRHMCDIDLLTRRKDVVRAAEILLANGYAWAETLPDGCPPDEGMCTDSRHHLPMLVNRFGNAVELHWTLRETIPVNIDRLFERSVAMQAFGQSFGVLSPEDLLLHLCINATLPRFELKIRGLYDIHRVIERYRAEIDWDVLFTRADKWKARKQVLLLVSMAYTVFDSQLPAHVTGLFSDRQLQDIQNRAFVCMFEENFVASHIIQSVMDIARSGGLPQAYRMFKARVFFPRESLQSSRLSIYLFYSRRLSRVLQNNMKKLFRLGTMVFVKRTNILDVNRDVDRIMEWMGREEGE